ncbi:MAG: hypothetical protein L0G74_11300 [Staphylococcus equorum]|nr:hypothetical protein [Staphylococcus equorum]
MDIFEEKHESDTQIIKNMARKILMDKKGESIYLRDIRRLITRELHREFTAGVYSSAMRDLIDEENGKIINVDRGLYMYVSCVKKHEINQVLDDCIISLKGTAYVDLLSVEEEDVKYIHEIKRMVEVIENLKFK